MEVEEEFEPAPEMEGVGQGGPGAGWTECFFSFALSFCFSLLAGRGERNLGAPLGLLDSAVAFFLLVILYFISRYMRLEGPWPCIWYANVSTSTFPGNAHNTKERCTMECTWRCT